MVCQSSMRFCCGHQHVCSPWAFSLSGSFSKYRLIQWSEKQGSEAAVVDKGVFFTGKSESRMKRLFINHAHVDCLLGTEEGPGAWGEAATSPQEQKERKVNSIILGTLGIRHLQKPPQKKKTAC